MKIRKSIITAIIAAILATLLGIPQEVAKETSKRIYCAVSPSDCEEKEE